MAMINNIPKGYKQSEIGIIPNEWEVKTINEAFEICNNLRLPISEDIRKTMQGDYPYYGPTKIQDYINEYRVEGEYALIGEDGDHFLKWKDIPMTQITYGKFNVNNHAHLIKGKTNITLTKWFYYFFKNRDITQHLTRQGAGRYKLSKGTLVTIPCAIPTTIFEQKAIANTLSDIDTLITNIEKLINKKRNIKQGAMQKLFQPQEGWEVKKLGDIGIFKGGNGFPIKHQGLREGKFPFFKVSDMNNEGNSIFMNVGNNWISETIKKDNYIFVFPPKSIVFAKVGAAIFLERKKILSLYSCIDNNMMGFILDEEKSYFKYIYYLFHTIKLGKLVSTTALPSLSGKEIASLGFLFPTKEKQKHIATILSDIDNEITALETKLEKYKNIKLGMMQNLLTGKIRLI